MKQSGFRPGVSCSNKLLSITHKILSAFGDGHEVRGIFSIYLKRLREFGKKVCFPSYNKMGYQEDLLL